MHCLYKKQKKDTIIILVYVDDILVTGDNLKLINDTKTALHQVFKMKYLGKLKYFLRIEFARSDKGILMHQRKYSLEFISELGLSASKPAYNCIDTNVKLTTREYDLHKNTNTSDDPLLPNITSYQILSQFLHHPKKSHMEAAMRVVRYVKSHLGLGVLISSNPVDKVSTFCDADWIACPRTRR